MSRKSRKRKFDITSNKILLMSIFIIVLIVVVAAIIGRGNSTTYTIEINGDTSVVVYKGSNYEDPGAKAYDEKNTDLSSQILVDSNLNVYKTGRYEIIYSLGDASVKRVVRVIDRGDINTDSSSSSLNVEGETTLTLKGDETVYIDVYGAYKEEGYTAIDTTDGNISKKVEVTHNVDNTKPGIYQVVYTVKNSLGITTSVKRNVVVMQVELALSLENVNYTNSDVGIKVNITDEYFDYLVLPDGSKVTSKNYIYKVSKNGEFKFISYNKYGAVRESKIEVSNIDKTSPTAQCSAEYKNGKTIVNVNASDNVGISSYVLNGKSYTSSVISQNSLVTDNNVVVYDRAGNSANCSCKVSTSVYIDSVKSDGVIVTINASTINSQISGYYFSYNNVLPDKNSGGYIATNSSSVDVVRLPGKTYIWAEDINGNVSEYKTITLSNDVLPMTMSGYTVLRGTKLSEYLTSKGWSLDEFNKLMARSVRAAGLYTKEGAATAGVTLQVVLAQKYRIKIPYWRGGKTSSTGAYGYWGMYRENPTYEGYNYYGMDCDGFVNWAYKNTGIVYNDILGNSYYYWSGVPVSKENGEVGDIIRRNGHVNIIIGKTDSAFIVAEAYGEAVGLIINTHPYSKTDGYIIIKGEKLISTYGHSSDYPSGF